LKSLRVFALALVLAVSAGACGSSSEGVDIEGAWARTSPAMATSGAAYMDLTASEDDALLSASVDPSIAGTVEVHEVVPVDSMSDDTMADDSMSDDTMEGMGEMTMQPVERIDLPAGETVSLAPGGYHIMLLDLAAPLEVGQTFDITLTFENAGEEAVTVEVRDSAP
jgi:copper(I)-binding protein